MKTNIAVLANEVLQACNIIKPPIDPIAIMEAEGIEMAPGNYSGDFDARLEYLPAERIFVVFYQTEVESVGRLRFTLAHELGHYYIPDHHEAILKAKPHFSKTGYESNVEVEREADEFAANLLMPGKKFGPGVRNVSVAELEHLSNVFGTSLHSAAKRMVDLTDRPCSVVFSASGKVTCAFHSLAMRQMGLFGIHKGDRVPDHSQTACLAHTGFLERERESIETYWWYKSEKAERSDYRVWEEVKAVGRYGYVTFLVYES